MSSAARARSVASLAAPKGQLAPTPTSAAQLIPDLRGPKTGYIISRWRVWLPDGVAMPDGSAWRYSNKAEYPVLSVHGGQGSTPSSTETNVLPTVKLAITAGQIPPCIVVMPDMRDPAPFAGTTETWGMNCGDGSYQYEDIIRYDLPEILRRTTRTRAQPARTAAFGFSGGAFQVLRRRMKFNGADAAVYVVADGPRLDADLGGAGAAYNNWTATERAKIFAGNQKYCQNQCPFSSTDGVGLFNTFGAGAAPLLMLRSDPGGGAPATQANSMNNAITRLTNGGIAFTSLNLDNAGFTPSHVLSQFMDAWIAEAVNHLGWMVSNGWS